LRIAAERRLLDKTESGMQRQVKAGSGLIAVFVSLIGIYFLFGSPSQPNIEDSENNPYVEFGPLSSGEIAPSEPAYDLASLPRIEIGQRLEFGIGKDNRALLSGWSVQEPAGIWSLGKNAAIGFVVKSDSEKPTVDYSMLLFEGMAFLAPGHPQQTVEVWVGNRKVDEVKLRNTQNKFALALDGVVLKDGSPVILSLRLPDAMVPAKVIYSNDPREIAFRIESLLLEL
jgi:hypothetical protein